MNQESSEPQPPPKRDTLHSPATAWAILALSLGLTVGAWLLADRYVRERARDNFVARANEAQVAIAARMLEYEQVLRGGVGLFAASDHVSRTEWRRYYLALDLPRTYPGIQGYGFTRWVAPAERARVIETVRAEGFPDFDIRPPGERDAYTAIVYLEPLAGRNLRAFGFDMWSESTRREAMTRARDTGEAALSGRVTLVQETDQAPQPGVLMYLPVYRHGLELSTADQRRQALAGFVYAPFRMYDLMQGILGARDAEVEFQVHDGAEPGVLLYDSAQPVAAGYTPAYAHRTTIDVAGRPWTLEFRSRPAFDEASESWQPALVFAGGLVVDVLLFLSIWQLWVQRARADVAAQAALTESKRADRRARLVVESSPNAVVVVDGRGRIDFVNAQAERLFGWPANELLGQMVEVLVPPQSRAGHPALRAGFKAAPQWRRMGERQDLKAVRKDGTQFPVEIGLTPIDTADGPMVMAAVADISERLAAQQRIEAALHEKTVLLNEVHHRVKNNLQVVSSLLSLQAGRTRHSEVRDALAESQNRVQAMALIHQLLYEGKGFAVVDLGHYLRGLIRLVQDTYREDNRRVELQLNVAQEVVLDLQRAVPCGLLVNELISNAYKHAFPGDRRGRITIDLTLEEDGQAVLKVSDDGVGIAPGRDALDAPTLGLQLVRMLASQINGRLAVEAGAQGTSFELRFVAADPRLADAV